VELSNLNQIFTSLHAKIRKCHMLSSSFITFFMDCLPAVGSVLRRPSPLGLVAVLRDCVAGGLRVCASRFDLTTGRLHVAACGLDAASGSWVGAVTASSAGRAWRVGAILGSVRVGRVCVGAGLVARTVRLVRGVGGGGGVGDHDRGGLAATKSDGGGLGGVRARAFGWRRRHAGVDCLGHGHDSRRRAVCGLVDVDRGSGRAGFFDGSGLIRLARVGRSNRADKRAGRWNTSDAVGDSRDVGLQNVSDGERGAVVSCSAVRVDGRAVGHERGQSLGHWVSAGRVDDRGRGSRNVRGRRLGWRTSALARGDSNDAGRQASLSLSSSSVSDRACCERSVSCSSFGGRVVLGRRRVTGRVRRLATAACGVHTTARVRRCAVTLAVRCGRVDRRLAMRRCWIDWRLAVTLAVRCGWVHGRFAVGVAVWCSWVHRRLAPDRAGGARRGRRPARVRVATGGIHWHRQRRAARSRPSRVRRRSLV
jgi:hypothetical protein